MAEITDVKVAEGTIKETECKKNYSCLSGKQLCRCEVDSTVGKIIFVKGSSEMSCKYCMSFGGSYICTCPTRNELYHRYKL